jgi:N-acetylglucosamine transport system permease protein
MSAALPARRRRRDWGAVGFVVTLLTPGLLLYTLLVLWPMAQSFWVALHRWRGVSGNMRFVGLENFVSLASDDKFRAALGHNLVFFGLVTVAVLGLSLLFANALAAPPAGGRERVPGAAFLRALFLFPNVVSIVAVSTLWMFLYNPNWGAVNAVAKLLRLEEILAALTGGGKPVTWLANSRTVLPAVAATYVWYVLGFYILLFRAGIQGIPQELNEAATVDGASPSQRFWRVTLPLLNDLLRLAVVYLVINSMNLFALIWVMAPPSGTAGATEVSLTYLYQKGFVEQQFGYATAIGAVNFVVVMGLSLLLQRLWKPLDA